MTDTAARLTDAVLPAVPVRQWVLSLPIEIGYRLAYDGPLIGAFLAVFLRTVQAWYRQQARAQGYTTVQYGSLTFVQRFGSALNLNPHCHVLMLDGVYACGEEGAAPVLFWSYWPSLRPFKSGQRWHQSHQHRYALSADPYQLRTTTACRHCPTLPANRLPRTGPSRHRYLGDAADLSRRRHQMRLPPTAHLARR
jgi:hypothetical protein